MDDELFTDDLDITSAETRPQLAALLRAIHLRADRPSLRTLEARTRHDGTPLSKTVVSEMLKGLRFPRKAVMLSFLRACGVPEGTMEPWRRAWERVAMGEQDPAVSPAYESSAMNGRAPGDDAPTFGPAALDGANGLSARPTRTKVTSGLTTALPEPWAGRSQDSANQAGRIGAVHGPLIRRRELGALLRRLRGDSRMTIEQVASRLLCSPSKVSRIETGFRAVTLRDVRDLCDLYRVVDAQRDYLMELALEGRRRGWWQSYDLPFAAYIGLEAGATSIEMYHATVLPGLLQTSDYARAIEEHVFPMRSPELIEQAIAVRLTRQRLLDQDDPPRLHVIIDEAALRRIIGNPAIMKNQLESIIEKSALPNIAVQVIPYDVGAHPALDSSFTMLGLPDPMPGVIYVEGLFGFIYLERPQDIERYQQIFMEVQHVALSERESIALIANAGKELRSKL